MLLKNLPTLLKVMITASARIRSMTTRTLENPHFDPAGFHVARAQMIIGLFYKAKKKRLLAIQAFDRGKANSFPIGTNTDTRAG